MKFYNPLKVYALFSGTIDENNSNYNNRSSSELNIVIELKGRARGENVVISSFLVGFQQRLTGALLTQLSLYLACEVNFPRLLVYV